MNLPKVVSWTLIMLVATPWVVLHYPTSAVASVYNVAQVGELDETIITPSPGDDDQNNNDDDTDNEEHDNSNDDQSDDSTDGGSNTQQGELNDIIVEDDNENDNEDEVKKIHDDLKDKIDNDEIREVSINPDDGDADEMGEVETEDHDGKKEKNKVPASKVTSIIEIETATGHDIKIRFNELGQATIEDNGVIIDTDLSIAYDVETGAITVKDSSGSSDNLLLSYFPGDLLALIPNRDQPTRITGLELEVGQDNTLTYRIKGVQDRKLLGVIPTSGTVSLVIDANTGQVIELEKPWYFDVFGLLFSI